MSSHTHHPLRVVRPAREFTRERGGGAEEGGERPPEIWDGLAFFNLTLGIGNTDSCEKNAFLKHARTRAANAAEGLPTSRATRATRAYSLGSLGTWARRGRDVERGVAPFPQRYCARQLATTCPNTRSQRHRSERERDFARRSERGVERGAPIPTTTTRARQLATTCPHTRNFARAHARTHSRASGEIDSPG